MHIYQVSSVFRTGPATWNRILDELERDRRQMLFPYQPLREALVLEMGEPGAGARHLNRCFRAPAKNKSEETTRARSRDGLNRFCTDIRPKLGPLRQNFMSRGAREPMAQWEGFELTGGFHFSAEDLKGTECFLYVHPADWPKERCEAQLELLTILAEQRYAATRKQSWFVDLGAGQIIPPPQRFTKLRNELKQTMRLLDDLMRGRKKDVDDQDA